MKHSSPVLHSYLYRLTLVSLCCRCSTFTFVLCCLAQAPPPRAAMFFLKNDPLLIFNVPVSARFAEVPPVWPGPRSVSAGLPFNASCGGKQASADSSSHHAPRGSVLGDSPRVRAAGSAVLSGGTADRIKGSDVNKRQVPSRSLRCPLRAVRFPLRSAVVDDNTGSIHRAPSRPPARCSHRSRLTPSIDKVSTPPGRRERDVCPAPSRSIPRCVSPSRRSGSSQAGHTPSAPLFRSLLTACGGSAEHGPVRGPVCADGPGRRRDRHREHQ
ncbi:visual pigment-like receptor peropsin [Sarotherodon galilaeus]